MPAIKTDLTDKWEQRKNITQIERTYTEVLTIGGVGPSLTVVEENVLNILQYFRDEGIVDGTVRVTVPGGDDFTYKAVV